MLDGLRPHQDKVKVPELLLVIFFLALEEGYGPETSADGVGGWVERKYDIFRLSGGVGKLWVGLVGPGGPTRHRGDGDDGGGQRPRPLKFSDRFQRRNQENQKSKRSDGPTSAHLNGMASAAAALRRQ